MLALASGKAGAPVSGENTLALIKASPRESGGGSRVEIQTGGTSGSNLVLPVPTARVDVAPGQKIPSGELVPIGFDASHASDNDGLIDRGADRPEILSALLRVQRRWIVRLRQDRALLGPDGRVMSAGKWADWALANRNVRGNAVTLAVSLPPADVPQFGTPPSLHLVVPTYTFFRNGKEERWLLLTCGLIGGGGKAFPQHVGPRQVRYDYALRWRAEDGKRFLGQVCRVERFMTRSFVAIERMLWCATLAGGFLSHLQREEPEISGELQQEVLYWDKDVVVLPVYRLARGLHAITARSGRATLAVNA
jgi:hypothetical protein